MEIRATIQYSAPMLKRAARRALWNRMGWSYVLALLVVLAILLVALSCGERSWRVGVLGTVTLFGIAVPIATVVAHSRMSLERFRALDNGRGELVLTEESLRFAGKSGAAEYAWPMLAFIDERDGYWLIGPSKKQTFVIALEGLSDEARDFIRRKIRA